MSETSEPRPGTITWADLTVGDAEGVRDFYERVVGWDHEEVDMGGYADFGMHPPGAEHMVAGVCHSRGVNADLPPVWLVYITVADIEESVRHCEALGGTVLVQPRSLGAGRFCVIRDPAGASVALFQST